MLIACLRAGRWFELVTLDTYANTDVKFGVERLASKRPHLFSKGALEALTKTVQAAWALHPSDARIIEDVLGQLVNRHALSGPLHGTCC